MYHEHPIAKPPDDPSATIWRYLTLAKFLDMLERRALYFSALRCLPDSFEGFPSKPTIEAMRAKGEGLRAHLLAEDVPDWVAERAADQLGPYQSFRFITYINCWTMSEYESMAMWQLYSHDGIAIRSTFQHLVDSLRDTSEQQTIGKVIYRDRRDPTTMEFPGDAFGAAFHKGMSFAFEQELRAAVISGSPAEGHPAHLPVYLEDLPKGINVAPVDLDMLIDVVHVAPSRAPWFKELVERVMKTYGLDKPTIVSSLDERPNFT
jgi:hypothetical protein